MRSVYSLYFYSRLTNVFRLYPVGVVVSSTVLPAPLSAATSLISSDCSGHSFLLFEGHCLLVLTGAFSAFISRIFLPCFSSPPLSPVLPTGCGDCQTIALADLRFFGRYFAFPGYTREYHTSFLLFSQAIARVARDLRPSPKRRDR